VGGACFFVAFQEKKSRFAEKIEND